MVDQRADERLSAAFHALSDPSRRSIIELLRNAEELRVTDIARTFTMSLNAVSKHLKVLEASGLVRRRIEGRAHWFKVDWAGLQQPYEWLHFYHHLWSGRLDALADCVQGEKNDE
ncbi:MAG: ArsR/SmtB family transcription factor [Planctomycetota bacterium]|jgi:DNA-binding transcriptional ArsR family regulator